MSQLLLSITFHSLFLPVFPIYPLKVLLFLKSPLFLNKTKAFPENFCRIDTLAYFCDVTTMSPISANHEAQDRKGVKHMSLLTRNRPLIKAACLRKCVQ